MVRVSGLVVLAGLLAATPATAQPRLTTGLGLGALTIPREDDSFTGGMITAQLGGAVSRRWAALVRTSYASDSIVDQMDGATVELRYLSLIPSVRVEDTWAWIEAGFGWVHGWRDKSGGVSGGTDHPMGQIVFGARLGTPSSLQGELMVGAMVGEAVAPWVAVGVRH